VTQAAAIVETKHMATVSSAMASIAICTEQHRRRSTVRTNRGGPEGEDCQQPPDFLWLVRHPEPAPYVARA